VREEGKSESVSTVLFTFTRFRGKGPVFRSVGLRGSTDRGCRHDPSIGGGLQEPEPVEGVY
jgi:hypothetical protein